MRITKQNIINTLREQLDKQYRIYNELDSKYKDLDKRYQQLIRISGANMNMRDSSMQILRSMCQALGELTEQIEHIR